MSHFSLANKKKEYAKKGIFHTNEVLAKKVHDTIQSIAKQQGNIIKDILDINVGGGGLLSVFSDDVAKYGMDIEAEFIEYTKEHLKGKFVVCDCLRDEPFNRKFDYIVGNYPFSLKGNGKEIAQILNAPFELSNTLDSAFILRNLNYLSNKGACVLISSLGILYKGGKEQKFREWLIQKNYIDCLEFIPSDKHFDDTKIATALIVLRKDRQDKQTITFKNEGLSREVHINEIKDNDYNLEVSRYVVKEIEKEEYDLDELNEEILENDIKDIKAKLAFYQALFSMIDCDVYIRYLRALKAIVTEAENNLNRLKF